MFHRSFTRRRYRRLRGLSPIRRVHDFDFLDLDGSANIPEGFPSRESRPDDSCAASAVSRILMLQGRAKRSSSCRAWAWLSLAETPFLVPLLSRAASLPLLAATSPFSLSFAPPWNFLPQQSRRLTRLRRYRYVSYLLVSPGLIALHVDGRGPFEPLWIPRIKKLKQL